MKPVLPSPINHLAAFPNNIDLFVKREDLIHPQFGGNKWRKLKFNIDHFKNNKYKCIVTFGGPFSNHIAATASICHHHNIKSIGIIRGTYLNVNNPTLINAKANGMEIINIPKVEYKLKTESSLVKEIIGKYEKPFVIPEGGSNAFAKSGLREMMDEIQTQYDYIFVAAGTGMTACGIIENSSLSHNIFIVNALNNPSLKLSIQRNLDKDKNNWTILQDYTFGGYAKVTEKLLEFNKMVQKKYNLTLDPVYNIKVFYAIIDSISTGRIKPNSKILYINTGGLQGIKGFEYISKSNWLH